MLYRHSEVFRSLLMGVEADKPAEDDMSEEKLLRALMEAQGPS